MLVNKDLCGDIFKDSLHQEGTSIKPSDKTYFLIKKK